MIYIALLILLLFIVGWLYYNRPQPMLDKNKIARQFRDVFLKFNEICKEAHVNFFICGGTLLGHIREKKFIDHDVNINIGMFHDTGDQLLAALQQAGFTKIIDYPENSPGGFTIAYNGVPINVQYFKPGTIKDQICWWSPTAKRTLCIQNFDLAESHFLGLEINIPNPPDEYLAQVFGKDWRSPKKKY